MSGTKKTGLQVNWSIENIKFWFKTRDDALYSPQFLAETLGSTRWKLRLSTNWHLEEKYISLSLQRDVEDDGPKLIPLDCELSFLALDSSHLKSKSCVTKFASKTVGHELNVKEVEVLNESEVYLPEGVLTVCCKLRNPFCKVSKGGECSIRSVIGTRCITLDGSIENFGSLKFPTIVTLNFMSPSTDVKLISFDVHFTGERQKTRFERVAVECKLFQSYSCTLTSWDAEGQEINICRNNVLQTLLKSAEACSFNYHFNWNDLNSQTWLQCNALKFKLELTYSPGVKSECIEYEFNNYEKLPSGDQNIKHLPIVNSEVTNFSTLNDVQLARNEETLSDTEDTQSRNEEEYFEASRMRNALSSTLKQDLSSLYDDRLFCDTKLQTDTETFPAHKNVLSARSPVFKKMFTTDMKEKACECINIPDISSDTVRRMIQFLYTDSTGDLEIQIAKDLYIAADKYDIASLKAICSSFLKDNLCPANVCEVIVLADMHQDKDLEFAAQQYVLFNDEEVFHSDEWKSFMKNYSALAAQLMYLKCTKK